ncbi:hypothetical protein FQA39_LY09526 [Lamprigera yunnana]|nr:hypothetical protein FQA39_LY09526 [Lamprigera yunnana]
MPDSTVRVFIGKIIHCNEPLSLKIIESGLIAFQNGVIIEVDETLNLKKFEEKHKNENVVVTILNDWQLLIPGLIDTHVHAPQYANIGLGLNKTLLDWLNEHTFPLESKFKDAEFAKRCYEAAVKKSISHGTTTACYFATVHADSSLILADVVIKHGQRSFIGKVNMTKNAPNDLLETSEDTIEETKRFIQAMSDKKNGLVQPIITPRFALSLDVDEMTRLGDLAKEHNLRIQTHMSECKGEIAAVRETFQKSYRELYEEVGLLTDKTILAHVVHFTEAELQALVKHKTSVAHCPSSNYNLRSGICDVKALTNAGINVGLGTDVSGGNNLGILNEMRNAMIASTTISFQTSNYEPLNYQEVFYLATLGGAKALSIDDTVGNFAVGKNFDALIVDMNVEYGNAKCLFKYTSLELLQKFIYVGDDRNITSVFVAGKQIKQISS